ncbi:hypothetical protein HQ533_05310 [Candidatus Woesearchaeota archaeon]|nr:hypothetical protein [Candidatus Woesearchaeota archaeon]
MFNDLPDFRTMPFEEMMQYFVDNTVFYGQLDIMFENGGRGGLIKTTSQEEMIDDIKSNVSGFLWDCYSEADDRTRTMFPDIEPDFVPKEEDVLEAERVRKETDRVREKWSESIMNSKSGYQIIDDEDDKGTSLYYAYCDMTSIGKLFMFAKSLGDIYRTEPIEYAYEFTAQFIHSFVYNLYNSNIEVGDFLMPPSEEEFDELYDKVRAFYESYRTIPVGTLLTDEFNGVRSFLRKTDEEVYLDHGGDCFIRDSRIGCYIQTNGLFLGNKHKRGYIQSALSRSALFSTDLEVVPQDQEREFFESTIRAFGRDNFYFEKSSYEFESPNDLEPRMNELAQIFGIPKN